MPWMGEILDILGTSATRETILWWAKVISKQGSPGLLLFLPFLSLADKLKNFGMLLFKKFQGKKWRLVWKGTYLA